jgi:hypothetical protein
VKAPRLRKLGTVRGLPVYLVDGERIRNETCIEFTQGANEQAYPTWCPRGEIWIDDAIHGAIDRMATVFHEIVELDLMKDGWTYNKAHDVASRLEVGFRRELAQRPPKAFNAKLVTAAIRATCPHCA